MDSIWYISENNSDASIDNMENVNEMLHSFQFLFDTSSDPILAVNLDGNTITEVNDMACELFQYGRHRFIGMLFDNLVANPAAIKRALKRHVSLLSGVKCINKAGQKMELDISCAYFKAGNTNQALIVCRNIVDNQKVEKQKILYESLATEVAKTESAFFMGEENERQRLARELHGHIGPLLVAVKLDLEQLHARKRETLSVKDIDHVLEKQTQAIKELRIVTSRLAEGFQFQEDINRAIQTLIDKFAEFSGMTIYCKFEPLPANLTLKFRYHLFRIIEESLTNALMHANARKISIRLSVMDNILHMYVLDNGQGMLRPLLKKDRGLWLLHQRAALLNGLLQIESVPERYFKVTLKVPLK